MLKEKLIEALLRSAMRFEEETHKFYTRCMEHETDPEVRELFRVLAGEELLHKERLDELLASNLEAVLEFADEEIPGVIDPPSGELEEADGSENRVLQVLRTALDHEISSHNFYVLLSKRAALSVLKKTFSFLALEEEGHVGRIRALIGKAEGGRRTGRSGQS